MSRFGTPAKVGVWTEHDVTNADARALRAEQEEREATREAARELDRMGSLAPIVIAPR